MDTYYEYLRAFSQELGSAHCRDVSAGAGTERLDRLTDRDALPQAAASAGSDHLRASEASEDSARSVRIVGECGTGKTLMSTGVAHTHAAGASYSAIAMCPPHLVLKCAREALITVIACPRFRHL